jgi:hypothetical protein
MSARFDHAPLIPVVSGGLIVGGLLGLFGWWVQTIDDAIAAADFGPRD